VHTSCMHVVVDARVWFLSQIVPLFMNDYSPFHSSLLLWWYALLKTKYNTKMKQIMIILYAMALE